MLTEEKENNGTVIHMLAASNLQMTGRDDEGMPTVNVMNEKVQSLIEKVYKNIENVNTAISYDKLQKTADIGTHPHIYTYARKVLFTNDQFLFVQNGLNVIKAFADMESDFGIVPNPKYDEDQEKYGHLIDKYALIFSIPVTCSNLERAAAVLEYSAWLSHTTLLPAYYDTTILSKRIRDERDVDMLDLVKASCFYDIAQIYGIGIDLAVWNAYTQGGNLASAYASAESVIQTKLDNLIEQFMK